MTLNASLATIQVTIHNTDRPIVVNTSSGPAAATGTALSAVDSLIWEWDRPSPRDHMGPGKLTLHLRFNQARAIELDARIDVTLSTDAGPVPIPGHWVESVSWIQTGGVWRYTVVAVNGIARAAATRLTPKPWPANDLILDRLTRINSIGPHPIVDLAQSATNLQSVMLAPAQLVTRDDPEDTMTGLELLERTANTWGLVIAAAPHGVAPYRPDASRLQWYGNRWSLHRTTPHPLPAAAVENTTRTLSRRGLVTRVEAKFTIRNTDTGKLRDATRVWMAPTNLPTAQATYPTDWVANETTASPVDPATVNLQWIGQIAAGLASDPEPAPILDTARVITSRVPGLIGALTSPQSTFQITPTPGDFHAAVAVTAATLDVIGGTIGLTVELQPIALTGTRPMRFSDWPDPAAPAGVTPVVFADLTGANRLPDALTGDYSTAPLTIADTDNLFHPKYWA